MRIDLHAHSDASDGTTSPAAMVQRAKEVGLDVVALTDHDTFVGIDDAQATADDVGIRLVPGVELSCTWSAGADDVIRLHLLGYLLDRDDRALTAELERVRRSRETRLEQMTDRLAADGVPITWEQVRSRTDGATPGRPHLADAMIAAGIVRDREQAFDQYLHQRTKYYVPHAALDVLDAIELVCAAGGVTVFAHPRARLRGRVVPDLAIEQMAAAGLAGVEVDHRDHAPPDRAELRELAAALDLAVTGSSDYHGAGKKDNELGENTTTPEMYERLMAR